MNDSQKLMIKIAKMYYEEGVTQTEIAQRMKISRPKISRLMQEAIEQGIVRIEIASTPGDCLDLMLKLQKKFDLVEAIVVNIKGPITYESVSIALGEEAAVYFQRVIKDGDIVGLTWGSALASMVSNLTQEKKPNCLITQLLGGLGDSNNNTHATELVSRAAMALGAKLSLIPAPGVVKTTDLAELLFSDAHINQALNWAKKTDVAFVGIGSAAYNPFLMQTEDIITLDEMKKLQSQGAVGDISLNFYDIDGKKVKSEFNQRVIGVNYEDIKNIPRVVGVAGGENKYFAILGALKGKLINSLIVDHVTAKRLLDEN